MSRIRHRTPGGQRRAGSGRYAKAVKVGTLIGPGGHFRPHHHAEEAQDVAPEKEDDDAGTAE